MSAIPLPPPDSPPPIPVEKKKKKTKVSYIPPPPPEEEEFAPVPPDHPPRPPAQLPGSDMESLQNVITPSLNVSGSNETPEAKKEGSNKKKKKKEPIPPPPPMSEGESEGIRLHIDAHVPSPIQSPLLSNGTEYSADVSPFVLSPNITITDYDEDLSNIDIPVGMSRPKEKPVSREVSTHKRVASDIPLAPPSPTNHADGRNDDVIPLPPPTPITSPSRKDSIPPPPPDEEYPLGHGSYHVPLSLIEEGVVASPIVQPPPTIIMNASSKEATSTQVKPTDPINESHRRKAPPPPPPTEEYHDAPLVTKKQNPPPPPTEEYHDAPLVTTKQNPPPTEEYHDAPLVTKKQNPPPPPTEEYHDAPLVTKKQNPPPTEEYHDAPLVTKKQNPPPPPSPPIERNVSDLTPTSVKKNAVSKMRDSETEMSKTPSLQSQSSSTDVIKEDHLTSIPPPVESPDRVAIEKAKLMNREKKNKDIKVPGPSAAPVIQTNPASKTPLHVVVPETSDPRDVEPMRDAVVIRGEEDLRHVKPKEATADAKTKVSKEKEVISKTTTSIVISPVVARRRSSREKDQRYFLKWRMYSHGDVSFTSGEMRMFLDSGLIGEESLIAPLEEKDLESLSFLPLHSWFPSPSLAFIREGDLPPSYSQEITHYMKTFKRYHASQSDVSRTNVSIDDDPLTQWKAPSWRNQQDSATDDGMDVTFPMLMSAPSSPTSFNHSLEESREVINRALSSIYVGGRSEFTNTTVMSPNHSYSFSQDSFLHQQSLPPPSSSERRRFTERDQRRIMVLNRAKDKYLEKQRLKGL